MQCACGSTYLEKVRGGLWQCLNKRCVLYGKAQAETGKGMALAPVADSEILPDWQQVWTIKEAEVELKDFQFNGPGWYHSPTSSMLVIPLDTACEVFWRQRGWSEGQRFRFMVYGRNPADAFRLLLHAPQRTSV